MLNSAIAKLAALGSSLGGPMYLFDKLRPVLGTMPAFLICFVPIGLQLLAYLSLDDEERDRCARIAVWGGIIGSVVLFAQIEYAIWELWRGARHPNHSMIVAGILIGIGSSAYLVYRATRFLRT